MITNAVRTAQKFSEIYFELSRVARASEEAPAWLYFLAKHFGEKQELNTYYNIVEVRQFFGVQYLIYK